MIRLILGLILLALFTLGIMLLTLSLFLMGLTLFMLLFGGMASLFGGGSTVTAVAFTLLIAASAGFFTSIVLCLVGMFAFSFQGVRTFLSWLRILLQFIRSLLPALPPILDASALALETADGFLRGEGSASDLFTQSGDSLMNASETLPPIPALEPNLESLWLELDRNGNRSKGYVPRPEPPLFPEVPDLSFITSFGVAPDMNPVTDAISNSGEAIRGVAEGIEGVGETMASTAEDLRTMSALIREVLSI